MQVSISEATRMVGLKSRSTFYRHIEKKGISLLEDDEGNPKVDVSELIRVYGDKVKLKNGQPKPNTNKTSKIEHPVQEKTPPSVQIELEVLKARLKIIEEERERERTMFENQLEDLRTTLGKAQDITLLLEDKRTTQGSEDSKMEQRLYDMNQVIDSLRKQNERFERKEKERQKRSEERRKQREIEEAQKSKSIWQKLFN